MISFSQNKNINVARFKGKIVIKILLSELFSQTVPHYIALGTLDVRSQNICEMCID